jgi:hypothetical protein
MLQFSRSVRQFGNSFFCLGQRANTFGHRNKENEKAPEFVDDHWDCDSPYHSPFHRIVWHDILAYRFVGSPLTQVPDRVF